MRHLAGSIILVATLLAGSAPDARSPNHLILLSLQNLQLQSNEYLEGFDIKTHGIEVVAVCQIPPGWEVQVGDLTDGYLSGGATLGASGISTGAEAKLSDLFLVREEAFDKDWNNEVPPTYQIEITLAGYGNAPSRGKLSRNLSSLKRTPASACPPPRGQ